MARAAERDDARRAVAGVNESQLQSLVIETAMLRRWRIHHSRPAMMQSGRWVTPLQGHRGLPDLILLRPPRLLFVELKSTRGAYGPGQVQWMVGLQAVDGVEYHLWRPKEWLDGTIDALLR